MIFGTIAVACVIKAQYGGWTALSPDTFLRPGKSAFVLFCRDIV